MWSPGSCCYWVAQGLAWTHHSMKPASQRHGKPNTSFCSTPMLYSAFSKFSALGKPTKVTVSHPDNPQGQKDLQLCMPLSSHAPRSLWHCLDTHYCTIHLKGERPSFVSQWWDMSHHFGNHWFILYVFEASTASSLPQNSLRWFIGAINIMLHNYWHMKYEYNTVAVDA